MKQSNYIPSQNLLSQSEKQLIESFFCGDNKLLNDKGVALNKTWHLSVLTGINERKIDRYLNRLIEEKRKKMNETD